MNNNSLCQIKNSKAKVICKPLKSILLGKKKMQQSQTHYMGLPSSFSLYLEKSSLPFAPKYNCIPKNA